MKGIFNLFFFIVLITGFSNCTIKNQSPVIARISFDSLASGAFDQIETEEIIISSNNGESRVLLAGGRIKSSCLFITGGDKQQVEFEIKDQDNAIAYLSLNYQRLSSDLPFDFKIDVLNNSEWVTIFNSDGLEEAGIFIKKTSLPIQYSAITKIRFQSDTPGNGGVLIDDLIFLNDQFMSLGIPVSESVNTPVILSESFNPVEKISISAKGEHHPKNVSMVKVSVSGNNDILNIDSLSIYYSNGMSDYNLLTLFDKQALDTKEIVFNGNQMLQHGENYFFVSATLNKEANIRDVLNVNTREITIGNKSYNPIDSTDKSSLRAGLAIRSHMQDKVHTSRIPGLVTTNSGTLIAVYDLRKNGAVDLQADIDVGMSRSTDGGNSWEPMKVIMDMGEWGGLPEDENGIGDPSILVDQNTNNIWVAGVWAHSFKRLRNFTSSQQGMKPMQTSQLMLVKSEDDGVTWSAPINITEQIKKEEWFLLLQGPGKGITMSNGTLVFPAQFKDKDQIPHATIIWSTDHGLTWSIGNSAKSNTTESQVIELKDGSLMLNMRDNRNRDDKSNTNGRAISITKDMGNSWEAHHTSNSMLEEPVCMGSLIKDEFVIDENKQDIVLFSNPASKYSRKNITIKFSFDDGDSWPSQYYTLLDSGTGRGYSCMTKIDNQHIGILYESSRADLVFQIVNLEEAIMKVNNL